jgi:hypothetical protein
MLNYRTSIRSSFALYSPAWTPRHVLTSLPCLFAWKWVNERYRHLSPFIFLQVSIVSAKGTVRSDSFTLRVPLYYLVSRRQRSFAGTSQTLR